MQLPSLQNQKLRSISYIVLSGILYGFLGYFGTHLVKAYSFSVPTMLFWRSLVSSLFMFLWTWKTWPGTRSLTLSQPPTLVRLFFLGFLLYAGSSIFYFFSSLTIGTGLSMVIFFSYPVFVMTLSWIFQKKKISKFSFYSFCGIILGLILLGQGEDSRFHWLGLVLAIISAFLYAVYVYLSEGISKQVDPKIATFIVSFSSTVAFFVLACVDQSFTYPIDMRSIVDILILGIFCTALPILLLLEGMKEIDATQASILSVAEPIVTLLIGYLLLNETILAIQLVGVFTIIVGAILVQMEKKKLNPSLSAVD